MDSFDSSRKTTCPRKEASLAKHSCHSSRSTDPATFRFVSFGPTAVAACFMVIAASTVARGDQIIVGAVSHSPVTIAGFDGGQLVYRTESGESKVVWFDEVQRMTVDRSGVFTDFNQAERNLAAGEPDKAIVRYRRTLHLSDSFWPELIAARLVQACAAADRIDQAALHFVRVLRGEHAGPALAVRLIPQRLPSRRDAKSIRAVEHIEDALQEAAAPEDRITLSLFRFALLHGIGDRRSLKAARVSAMTAIPERIRCDRAYTVQLTALEQSLADAVDEKLLAALDRAIRDCPRAVLPGFLVLRGESLIRVATTREQYIRAAWPFMRVVVHMPDHKLVPRALFGAARAVEHIGRGDKAIELLEEGLAHAELDPETREIVQQSLDRLRAEYNRDPTAVE